MSGNRHTEPQRKNIMSKDIIEALKQELKHYEIYGKAKRAEEVKKAIKELGGKVETASKKPKTEKKVETKK
mgnify:FL=1